MAIYLDTSVVASMFVTDAHSRSADEWLSRTPRDLTLSDWTVTEFVSALGAASRAGRIQLDARYAAERALDFWISQQGSALAVSSADVRRARVLMRETEAPLRAADALHLAVVLRTRHALATYDVAMQRAAGDLGLPVEDLSPHP